MRATRQTAQHTLRVGQADGLAEYLPFAHHHGVGADDGGHACVVFGQHLLHHGAGFALGQLLARLGRVGQKVGLQRFVHIGRMHHEAYAGVFKQLLAARRRAGQHDVEVGHCRVGRRSRR